MTNDGRAWRSKFQRMPICDSNNRKKPSHEWHEKHEKREEANSQVIGAVCDKVFSFPPGLFVSFVAAFSLYGLNHKIPIKIVDVLPGIRTKSGFIAINQFHWIPA